MSKLKERCISCAKEGYDTICKDCRAQGINSVWAIFADLQERVGTLEILLKCQTKQIEQLQAGNH